MHTTAAVARTHLALLLTALSLVLVVFPPHALAQEYPARSGDLASSSGSVVAPGEEVAVSGSGFAPGADVTITIESDPIVLGTTTAGASGAIATVVTIPSSLPPGSHTLKATGAAANGGVLVLAQAVQVTGDAGDDAAEDDPVVGEPTSDTSILAFTGLSTTPLLAVAVGLLVSGGAALYVSRRRRS